MKVKVISWGGVLAAMVFCVWLTMWVRPTVNLLPDSTYYLSFAKNVRQGKFYIDHRAGVDRYVTAPVYPILIAAFSGSKGNIEKSGRMISLTATLLLIVATFVWTRKMFGPWAGLAAAWLIACSHPQESIQVLTESLFAFLYMAAVWRIWEASATREIWKAVVAGSAAALATLTRELGIVAVPFGVAVIFIGTGGEGVKSNLKAKAIGALSFLMAWCVLMAPYWVYSLHIRGTWWGSRFSERLARGDAQYIKTDAFDMLYQLGNAVRGIWGLYPGYITLAAVFGLVMPGKFISGRDGVKRLFILSWIVLNVLALDLLAINTQGLWLRYLFPVGPFILILAARGLAVAGETVGWAATRIKPSVAGGVRTATVILITFLIIVGMFAGVSDERAKKLGPPGSPRPYVRGTPEISRGFLEQYRVNPSIYVYDRRPFIAYDLDVTWAGLSPDLTTSALIKESALHPVLLIVDSVLVDQYNYENLRPLLANKDIPEGAHLLQMYYFPEYGPEGKLVAIYSFGNAYSAPAAVRPDDMSREAHILEAGKWLEKGRMDMAQVHLEAAISLDPSKPDAHVQLARLLYVQGSLARRADVLQDAINHLQQAAANDPLNMQIRDEICGASKAKYRIDGSATLCRP